MALPKRSTAEAEAGAEETTDARWGRDDMLGLRWWVEFIGRLDLVVFSGDVYGGWIGG